MENKPNQKNLLLEIAEQKGEIISSDNKTLAKFEWLRPWSKNPRTSNDKNLKKLEQHIKELGIYKPLLVYLEKDNATILGGNMRYKVLSKLREEDKTGKYDYVWVSVVNANNDVDKLKYALSDNFSAGEYTKEKLKELVKVDQLSMFDGYDIGFEEQQSLDQFIEDLAVPVRELEFRNVEKKLENLGINKETIGTLKTMVEFSKTDNELENVEIKGEIVGQKFPVMFWFTDILVFNQVKELFGQNRKYEYDVELFKTMIQKNFGITLPTTEHKMEQIMEGIKKLDVKIEDAKELGGDVPTLEKQQQLLKAKFKELYETIKL